MANVAVGVVVLCIGWSLGGRPGVGTVANAVLVGVFIQLLPSIDAVTRLAHDALGVRIPLLVAGIVAHRAGVGVLHRRRPRRRAARHADARRRAPDAASASASCARRSRSARSPSASSLGGTFGVGTVLFALLVGPIIEASFAAARADAARSPVARARAGRDRGVSERSHVGARPTNGAIPRLRLPRGVAARPSCCRVWACGDGCSVSLQLRGPRRARPTCDRGRLAGLARRTGLLASSRRDGRRARGRRGALPAHATAVSATCSQRYAVSGHGRCSARTRPLERDGYAPNDDVVSSGRRRVSAATPA